MASISAVPGTFQSTVLTRAVAALAVLALTPVGCAALGTDDAGHGGPTGVQVGAQGESASPSASASPTPTATPSPTRTWPHHISLTRADSCRIRRAIPPSRFGSTAGKIEDSPSLQFPGNTDCFRLGKSRYTATGIVDDDGITLSVTAVTNESVDSFLDTAVGIEDRIVRRLSIEGLRAVVARSNDPGACYGLLDVAEHQQVYVVLDQPYTAHIGEVVVPRKKLCELVPTALIDALHAVS
ncbi:hypothetical protein ABN034_06575 [Actinopolymorpha sp. B11F2]|uniref:hypothetical protein n=1 Tax=Actinopolymorpha sp. B11F2 TaxID=3160862 RepID=UPI0032E519F8